MVKVVVLKVYNTKNGFLKQINQKHNATYPVNLKVLFFQEIHVQDVASGNQSIHSFDKRLLSFYSISGVILCAGNAAVNKPDIIFWEMNRR